MLVIRHGINIYTLGKINVISHQRINGSVIICFFRLIKCKEIAKIKSNKVFVGITDVLSILSFITYHLYVLPVEISYLFLVIFSYFSSMIICWAKFNNYKTIKRYSIEFISGAIKIGEIKEKKNKI